MRGLLLDCYLGSQKTEGDTYATLLHHPFLFKGKPTHAQEVAHMDLTVSTIRDLHLSSLSCFQQLDDCHHDQVTLA